MSSTKLKTPLSSRPPAAVELRGEGVLAASLAAPGQPVYAFEPLPQNAFEPSVHQANLQRPDAVANAMRRALGQLSLRGKQVTLMVPDLAVRVFVLDFDSLPAKAAEALPVLRFRLRKMVPFDVETAGLSYQLLPASKDELVRVLVVVIPSSILAEYEAVVREAGFEPGAVLPSSLAALPTLDSLEAVLAAQLTARSLTTLIVNGDDLLLYRTVDLPTDDALRAQEIQRGMAVASAYYEDRLGARVEKIFYAGEDADGFAHSIAALDFLAEPWGAKPETGAATALGTASIAGVTGALAGVR